MHAITLNIIVDHRHTGIVTPPQGYTVEEG